jgi:hypothetical protein
MHPFIHMPVINPTVRPRLTFIDDYEAGSTNPATASSASFGNGGANGDMLVISVGWNNGSATSGCTVDGNSATLAVQDSGGSSPDQARAALFYINAPAASSGDIVISFSGAAPGGAGTTVGVWRVRGLDSQTPLDTSSANSDTFNAPKNAVIIGTASFDNSGGSTYTGVGESYDTNLHSGGGIDGATENASYVVEVTGPGGASAATWAIWR